MGGAPLVIKAMRKSIVHIPPVFLFTILILIITLYFLLPGYNLIPFPYNLCGVIAGLAGFIIMGKAHDRFRQYKTTLKIAESKFMIKDGPFAFSRNPMYLGMSLLLLGFAIGFANLLTIALPFLFWLYLSLIIIPVEEDMMKRVFGTEYLQYKKSVRRWI
jgi:protein-S-isoprenylcysteine O-methyltransferase Ste14